MSQKTRNDRWFRHGAQCDNQCLFDIWAERHPQGTNAHPTSPNIFGEESVF